MNAGGIARHLLLFTLLLSPWRAGVGAELSVANPSRVKAAFLHNFAHYVTWPSGAIIRFRFDERVHISVNLDQARASALNIQTRMLEVSSEVLEHGSIRGMR